MEKQMDDKRQRALEKKKLYTELLSKFPIALTKSKTKGRHMIASQDLLPGTVVLKEIPVAYAFLKHNQDEYCISCLQEIRIPLDSTDYQKISCFNCRKQTFYCSMACKTKDQQKHNLECDIIKDLPGIAGASACDYSLLRLIVSFLANRVLYKDEKSRLNFKCVKDMISNQSACSPEWIASVRIAVSDIMELIQDPIQTSVQEMIQLACQINSNSFVLNNPNETIGHDMGVSFLPLSALFNHSCAPNVVSITDPLGNNIIRTVKNVRQGEELCLSYIDLYLPVLERRGRLLETKHFWCECERCALGLYEDLESISCSDSCPGFIARLNEHICPCNHCGNQMTKEAFYEFTRCMEAEYDSAFELIKIRQFSQAKTGFESFFHRYKTLVHPLHYHFFNCIPPLVNACTQEQSFEEAIYYLQLIIQKMDSAHFIPDFWPEKADFLFRLGELNEILAEAIKRNLCSGNAEEIKVRSMESYQRCMDMREIIYGKDHPILLETLESLLRVKI